MKKGFQLKVIIDDGNGYICDPTPKEVRERARKHRHWSLYVRDAHGLAIHVGDYVHFRRAVAVYRLLAGVPDGVRIPLKLNQELPG